MGFLGGKGKNDKSKSLFGKASTKKKKKVIRGKILLGVDIGSKITRVLVGTCKTNKIEIEQYAGGKNAEDVAYNGKIANTSEAETYLKALIRNSGISVKDVVTSLESTDIIKRDLIIPDVSDDDILGLITYEMGQYLPIDISSYGIRFKKTETFTDDNGVVRAKVSVIALPKSISKTYADVFGASGLVPYYLDMNSNSIEKLLKFDVENSPSSPFKDRNVVFIDMGHSFFNISLYNDTNYLFSKIIEIGGSMIDSIISKQLNINAVEAEKFKLELSSRISIMDLAKKFADRAVAEQNISGNQRILLSLMDIIDKWLFEIDNVLKYYTTRNRKNAIDEIYLYGGCSSYKDIDKYFEYRLNIKTSIITHLDCVQCKDGKIEGNIPNFLNLLGALIIS